MISHSVYSFASFKIVNQCFVHSYEVVFTLRFAEHKFSFVSFVMLAEWLQKQSVFKRNRVFLKTISKCKKFGKQISSFIY